LKQHISSTMFGRCRIGEKHWTDDSGTQGTN